MGCDKISEILSCRVIQCSPQIIKTALVPDSQVLLRLSQHLVRSRPPSSLPFPGSPTPQDLDFLASSEDLRTLSSTDQIVLRNLRADLFRICQRAKERQVKVVVDAEYRSVVLSYFADLTNLQRSWYQVRLFPVTSGTMADCCAACGRRVHDRSQSNVQQPVR